MYKKKNKFIIHKIKQRNKLFTNIKENPIHSVATGPRKYTVSVALPESIITNAQGLELKTYLVGQVYKYIIIFFKNT